MAKKKSIWDAMPTDSIQEQAKKSIEKTATPKTKNKTGPKQFVEMDQIVHAQITKDARRLLKKIAAYEDVTMLEFISRLVEAEAQKRGLK